MVRLLIASTVVLAALLGGPVSERLGLVPAASGAALSAQALYADAMAKDHAVRKAIESGMPAASISRAVATVLTAYDGLLRQYPASSYSDDALWRAAQLATDIAALLKDPSYQAMATRYLRRLASEYPTSKHARQVPGPSLPAAAIAAPARTAASAPAPPALPAPPVAVVSSAPTAGVSNAPAAAVTNAPAVVERARLLAIHRAVLPDVVRLTLDIDHEVIFRQERLSGPERIFFDFARTTVARSLAERTIRFDHDTDVVRHVRIGLQSSDTTRVVLDATGVASCSASPLYGPVPAGD